MRHSNTQIVCLLLVFSMNVLTAQDTTRPAICGDLVINVEGETCDDGNIEDGDGCSATCTLETGYMCYGSMRTDPLITPASESCTGADICEQATQEWSPFLYAYKNDDTPPPVAGWYCKGYCESFPVVDGYEMNTDCQLQDINECQRGTASCAQEAYCENKVPAEFNGAGYRCFCDPQYFTSAVEGASCSDSGVEIVIVVASMIPVDDPQDELVLLRDQMIVSMVQEGTYITGDITAEAIMEGVEKYPVEVLGYTGTQEGFEGRNLYQMKIRLPIANANVEAFSAIPFLEGDSDMKNTLEIMGQFNVYTRSVCGNDKDRSCTTDGDCLSGGVCVHGKPDVDLAVLTAGGSSAPIQTSSSGFELIYVAYDPVQAGWNARVRYDTTDPAVVNVLYLSHVGFPVSPDALGSFNLAEFPCQAPGTGVLEQRREDTVCCFNQLYDVYTTTQEFGDYISGNGPTSTLASFLGGDGCVTRVFDHTTKDILETTPDFVSGGLARMPRSAARIDNTITRGYQDVLLFLAEEDVRHFAGLETPAIGGYGIKFFIGMLHVTGLNTDRIGTSFSQVNINSNIQDSFLFTSSAQTDETFVKDVNVNLLQIPPSTGGGRRLLADGYSKFARVQVTIPDTVTTDSIVGLIPFSSAIASVGYSKDTASALALDCGNWVEDTTSEVTTTTPTIFASALDEPYCPNNFVSKTFITGTVEFVKSECVRLTEEAGHSFMLVQFQLGQAGSSDAGYCYVCPSTSINSPTPSSSNCDILDYYSNNGCVYKLVVPSGAPVCAAFSEPVCSTVGQDPASTGGQVVVVFPLPESAWSTASLSPDNLFDMNLYLSFVVRIIDTAGNPVLSTLETSTPINALTVKSMCDEDDNNRQADGNIADVVQVDLLLGMSESPEVFDTSVVQALDITRSAAPTTLARDVSSKQANAMTIMVKGLHEAFNNSHAQAYTLEIEDMITIHILSDATKVLVDSLIDSDEAFIQVKDPNSDSVVRLVPSEQLLSICPVANVQFSYGCITRLDIQERVVNTLSNSITRLSPTVDEEGIENELYGRTGLWARNFVGDSAFAESLGYAHNEQVVNMFSLNNRYRKGFILSPTIPWRQTDMDNAGITSALELSQHTISAVLVALDRNEDTSPTGLGAPEIKIPMRLPLTQQDLRQDLRLVKTIEAVLADSIGLDTTSVRVDGGSLGSVKTVTATIFSNGFDQPGCVEQVHISPSSYGRSIDEAIQFCADEAEATGNTFMTVRAFPDEVQTVMCWLCKETAITGPDKVYVSASTCDPFNDAVDIGCVYEIVVTGGNVVATAPEPVQTLTFTSSEFAIWKGEFNMNYASKTTTAWLGTYGNAEMQNRPNFPRFHNPTCSDYYVDGYVTPAMSFPNHMDAAIWVYSTGDAYLHSGFWSNSEGWLPNSANAWNGQVISNDILSNYYKYSDGLSHQWWQDSEGYSCAMYKLNTGWDDRCLVAENYAVNGWDAKSVCCVCGGGMVRDIAEQPPLDREDYLAFTDYVTVAVDDKGGGTFFIREFQSLIVVDPSFTFDDTNTFTLVLRFKNNQPPLPNAPLLILKTIVSGDVDWKWLTIKNHFGMLHISSIPTAFSTDQRYINTGINTQTMTVGWTTVVVQLRDDSTEGTKISARIRTQDAGEWIRFDTYNRYEIGAEYTINAIMTEKSNYRTTKMNLCWDDGQPVNTAPVDARGGWKADISHVHVTGKAMSDQEVEDFITGTIPPEPIVVDPNCVDTNNMCPMFYDVVMNEMGQSDPCAWAVNNDPGMVVACCVCGGGTTGSNTMRRLLSTGPETSVSQQRHLLQTTNPSVDFDVVVRVPFADSQRAVSKAQAIARDIMSRTSPLFKRIADNMRVSVLSRIAGADATGGVHDVIRETDSIAVPAVVGRCIDDSAWSTDVTRRLGISNARHEIGHMSCTERWYTDKFGGRVQGKASSIQVTPRGPAAHSDWDKYHTRSLYLSSASNDMNYNFVTDLLYQEDDWMWWDFASQPPNGRYLHSGGSDFVQEWLAIKEELATRCCLCQKTPIIPGSSRAYVHPYSWPVLVHQISNLQAPEHDVDKYMLINPQINLAMYKQQQADTPPRGWVSHASTGQTMMPVCVSGSVRTTVSACEPCPEYTFGHTSTGNRRQQCMRCPENTFAPRGSSKSWQCVCSKGFTAASSIGNGTYTVSECAQCPMNTFKESAGKCEACPDGLVSRVGTSSIFGCVPSLSSTRNTTGTLTLFPELLGLIGLAEPVLGTRECMLVSHRTSVSCPSGTYEGVFQHKPIASATADNAVSVTTYSVGDTLNFKDMTFLYFHAQHQATSRLMFSAHPGGMYSTLANHRRTFNLRDSVKMISLVLPTSYMGPSPPGMGTRIMNLEDVISAKLRLSIPGVNLRSRQGKDMVRMVMFLSSKPLDQSASSRDWEWIVCGHKVGTETQYKACADEPDPDNTNRVNIKNKHVLATHISELNSDSCCKSCFHDSAIIPGCYTPEQAHSDDHMYDNTIQWTHNVQQSPEEAWLYVFFMVGDSQACTDYACNEATVYAQDSASRDVSTTTNILHLLPGTQFSQTRAVQGGVTVRASGKPAVKVVNRRKQSTSSISKGPDKKRAFRLPIKHNIKQKKQPVNTHVVLSRNTNRHLLQDADSDTTGNLGATALREITSISNSRMVTDAVCQNRQEKCAMLQLSITVDASLYCTSDIILSPALRQAAAHFLHATSHGVSLVAVTNILRQEYTQTCTSPHATAARRLMSADPVVNIDIVVASSNQTVSISYTPEDELNYRVTGLSAADGMTVSIKRSDVTNNSPPPPSKAASPPPPPPVPHSHPAPHSPPAPPSPPAPSSPTDDDDNLPADTIVLILVLFICLIALSVLIIKYCKSNSPQTYPEATPQKPQHNYAAAQYLSLHSHPLHNTPHYSLHA